MTNNSEALVLQPDFRTPRAAQWKQDRSRTLVAHGKELKNLTTSVEPSQHQR